MRLVCRRLLSTQETFKGAHFRSFDEYKSEYDRSIAKPREYWRDIGQKARGARVSSQLC